MKYAFIQIRTLVTSAIEVTALPPDRLARALKICSAVRSLLSTSAA
jgi:hypothetical protein